jgi:hypothetical protein
MPMIKVPGSPLGRAAAHLNQTLKARQAAPHAAPKLIANHAARFESYMERISAHPAMKPPYRSAADHVIASAPMPNDAVIFMDKWDRPTKLYQLSIEKENGRVMLMATIPNPHDSDTLHVEIPNGTLAKHFPPSVIEPKTFQKSLASMFEQMANFRGVAASKPQQKEAIGLSGERALAGLDSVVTPSGASKEVATHWQDFSTAISQLNRALNAHPAAVAQRLTKADVQWVPAQGPIEVDVPGGPMQVSAFGYRVAASQPSNELSPRQDTQVELFARGSRNGYREPDVRLPNGVGTKGRDEKTSPATLERALADLLNTMSRQLLSK